MVHIIDATSTDTAFTGTVLNGLLLTNLVSVDFQPYYVLVDHRYWTVKFTVAVVAMLR